MVHRILHKLARLDPNAGTGGAGQAGTSKSVDRFEASEVHPGAQAKSLLNAFHAEISRALQALASAQKSGSLSKKETSDAAADLKQRAALVQSVQEHVKTPLQALLVAHLANLKKAVRPEELKSALNDLKNNKLQPEDILGVKHRPRSKWGAEQKQLLDYLVDLSHGNFNVVADILRGAHVQLRDDGKIYQRISQDKLIKADLHPYVRISSHASSAPQYGMALGKDLRTLLVGKDQNGDTWLQLEGAPWGVTQSVKDNIQHALDYIKYKVTGRNQGPFGSSQYTDRNPLILAPTKGSRS